MGASITLCQSVAIRNDWRQLGSLALASLAASPVIHAAERLLRRRRLGGHGHLAAVVGGVGGACLVHARSCGRMHCYHTGPFFLLMALVSLAYGLRWMPLGPHGWLYLGAALLTGGGLLGFVPEWLWGRYRPAQTNSHAC